MTFLAKRITDSPKKSYGMAGRAANLTDEDVIHLELGRPYQDTPAVIKDATIKALLAGKVHYSDFRGLPELREALARKLQSFNGIQASADQVLVTNGLTQASYAAFMATVDPGDEVILLEPYYPQHVGKIALAGGTPVFAQLDAKRNFALDPSLIEPHITERTKAIVIVNPCNPTGRVYTREELEGLAQLCQKHDLLVMTDEVYENITFDGRSHISIASLPGMAERTISMFAYTKAYAMDGWRLGYVTATQELIDGMLKITTSEVTHVNTFIQEGALAAIVDGANALKAMVEDDRLKRDFVVRALQGMRGVRCELPEGTIYAFPDISATGWPSQELADALLEQCRVVVEAGSFYGSAGEGHLRICFGSQSLARLETAMLRMHDFFERLEFRT
ncbi:MAG TPA: pyridoxal phosphate-dependent aminotransferase [Steroidobacter sp.]